MSMTLGVATIQASAARFHPATYTAPNARAETPDFPLHCQSEDRNQPVLQGLEKPAKSESQQQMMPVHPCQAPEKWQWEKEPQEIRSPGSPFSRANAKS